MNNPIDPEETAGQADFWEEANAKAQPLVILSQDEAAELRRRVVERAAVQVVPGYTPGPWRVATYKHEDGSKTLCIKQDKGEADFGGYILAQIADGTGNDEGNARLLAAAPQMLTALQETRDLLKTLLQVAVFLNADRRAVIERVERLEELIGEVSDG